MSKGSHRQQSRNEHGECSEVTRDRIQKQAPNKEALRHQENKKPTKEREEHRNARTSLITRMRKGKGARENRNNLFLGGAQPPLNRWQIVLPTNGNTGLCNPHGHIVKCTPPQNG